MPGTRDKNISNYRPGEKRKNIIGQNKGENTIFYIHQKPTQLKIYLTKEKNK